MNKKLLYILPMLFLLDGNEYVTCADGFSKRLSYSVLILQEPKLNE